MDNKKPSTDSVLAHLFDAELDDGKRAELLQQVEVSDDLQKQVIAHSMIHGMLHAQKEARGDPGKARVARVLLAIRGSRKNLAMPVQWRWAALLLATLMVGGMLSFLIFGNEATPTPPGPLRAEHAYHKTLKGEVRAKPLTGGQWEFEAASPATLRFANGALAVMSKGATLRVADEGNRFIEITGLVSLEGSALRVPFDDRPAMLYGGPLVYSVADTGGGMIDLMSGVVQSIDGQPVLSAGERFAQVSKLIESMPSQRLDPEIAAGRAAEVFATLQSIIGDRMQLNEERWMVLLKPILAEPVSRKIVIELSKGLAEGMDGASDDESSEIIEVIGMMVELQLEVMDRKGIDIESAVRQSVTHMRRFEHEMSSKSAEHKEKFRASIRANVDRWRTATPEQREQMKYLLRMMLGAVGQDGDPLENK